jgi:hypothetical protein
MSAEICTNMDHANMKDIGYIYTAIYPDVIHAGTATGMDGHRT